MHVMAPLKQEKDFDFVHDFAHAVVILMQNIHPELVTASPKHDHRAGMHTPNSTRRRVAMCGCDLFAGKIFIDYVRNSYNQTTVMPYSTRAQARAPVACPVAWDELPSITSSRQFDIERCPPSSPSVSLRPPHHTCVYVACRSGSRPQTHGQQLSINSRLCPMLIPIFFSSAKRRVRIDAEYKEQDKADTGKTKASKHSFDCVRHIIQATNKTNMMGRHEH